MSNEIFTPHRKSYMSTGEIFFWTATINSWQLLLWDDRYKNVIVNSLRYLSEKGKIDLFAFVIMPNHIHLIWRTNELNGKETAQGSFLKFTAHEFRRMLLNEDGRELKKYAVTAHNKRHEFWQRDSLAIHLYSGKVAYQKMNYIHNNPVTERWKLVKDPCDYIYSSASFYEKGEKRYDFLEDLRNEF
ncbi:transposase [Danxiaibacter flavus]|uniref:Transposase n=1 Tax=Danxiaibacter flavus TaxID=3049108 RepID=A0ABV3ZPI8_9BACT|nr:transposase [Chitinophagaceae bacterium DXS]